MTFIEQAIDSLYMAAKAKGITIKKACELAGIHPTTVSRWRSGCSPRMLQFQRIYTVIENYKSTDEEVITMAKKAKKKPVKKAAKKVVKLVTKKKKK